MYLSYYYKHYHKILVLCFNFLMIKEVVAAMSIHFKCRSPIYPRSTVKRFLVPDDKVPWLVSYSEYEPPLYTAPSIHGQPWADPEIGKIKNKYFIFSYNIK